MIVNQKYDKLLSLLKERETAKSFKNMDILVKVVPDSDVEGVLDPRLLEVMQRRPNLIPKICFQDLDENEKKAFANTVRGMLFEDNIDITHTEIITERRTIEGINGSIGLRIYYPQTKHPLPAIVYFHGGAFYAGTPDYVENPCKALSEKSNAVVINVDYRLAPENPYPMGLNDCFDAVKWVYDHAEELNINRDYIGVAGDSAGGNLAAVCAMKDRDMKTAMIRYQALIYPAINLNTISTKDFQWSLDEYTMNSNQDIIKGLILSLESNIDPLLSFYLQGNEELYTEAYASPLFADNFEGLPPAVIITAEYDYLRLEDEAYARALNRAGVRTKLIRYNGMDHGFIGHLGLYPQSEDCIDEIAKEFRTLLLRIKKTASDKNS